MSAASDRAQMPTTARTAWRRTPWRSTKAFWAPMATIRDSPVPKPAAAVVRVLVMRKTLVAAHVCSTAKDSYVRLGNVKREASAGASAAPSVPVSELPLDQVRTLLAVVDEGTFGAAAAVLHVTPSAVRQRVNALEQRTGRGRLLRTQRVRPTEAGPAAARRARPGAPRHRTAPAPAGGGQRGLPGELVPARPQPRTGRAAGLLRAAPGGRGAHRRAAAGGHGDGRGDLLARAGPGLFGPAPGADALPPRRAPGVRGAAPRRAAGGRAAGGTGGRLRPPGRHPGRLRAADHRRAPR